MKLMFIEPTMLLGKSKNNSAKILVAQKNTAVVTRYS